MKIRTDFVTNSSSSSFILVGKQVESKDIDLANGKYMCIGKNLCEGSDVFYLDNEMLEHICKVETMSKLTSKNNYSMRDYLSFYKVFLLKDMENYDDNNNFTINELSKYIKPNEEFNIINVCKDYISTSNVNDLIDRYYDDEEEDDY